MFLDGQLRALAEEKKRLTLQSDLQRRLLHLEIGLAGAAVRRELVGLTAGLRVARHLMDLLRRR